MLRSLRSLALPLSLSVSLLVFLSLSLLFAANASAAAPVMTFTATSASTGIASAAESQWTGSTFIEHGDRYNFTYTLRDELVIENGVHSIYHYRDVHYDVAGQMRDWVLLNVDGAASGAHTVQFTVAGTLDATQTARLVDSGDQSFGLFLALNGGYVPDPASPDPAQAPPPPVYAETSSGEPVPLPGAWAMFFPDELTFTSSLSQTFTAPLGLPAYEFSYLISGNEGLLSEQAAFMLHGPAYDGGIRNLFYSELLGVEVLPVPELDIWLMLLAGAGVLGLSRQTRAVIFRN